MKLATPCSISCAPCSRMIRLTRWVAPASSSKEASRRQIDDSTEWDGSSLGALPREVATNCSPRAQERCLDRPPPSAPPQTRREPRPRVHDTRPFTTPYVCDERALWHKTARVDLNTCTVPVTWMRNSETWIPLTCRMWYIFYRQSHLRLALYLYFKSKE